MNIDNLFLNKQIDVLRNTSVAVSVNSRLIPNSIAMGAAVLGGNFEVYKGCYYPGSTGYTTVHAEHAALVNAVTNGVSKILAVAIFANNESLSKLPLPCGACLQAIADIAISNNLLISISYTTIFPEWVDFTLSDLLPMPWTLPNLPQKE